MSKKVAIGIDLGTTHACVGVFQNGRVDIIANKIGSRITPSYVAFSELETLIGEAARNQAHINPKNTIFQNKRLIGCKFSDAAVQKSIKELPFEVFNDNGAPMYRVQYMDQEMVLAPEQISALVLTNIKSVAETYIGQEVHDAVITVPAHFNDSQRQATIDAGKIAGLNVLALLNEPTAAAMAYGIDKGITKKVNVLVYDLGGGTFDVTILTIENKDFVVKAVGGNGYLGGCDFDNLIVDHIMKVVKKKYNKDISRNKKAMGKLLKACEGAKIGLSGAMQNYVVIDSLFDGKDLNEPLTREKCEELCADLFSKTIETVRSVLAESKLNKKDIDEVVLAGGSSRIPKIQSMLSKFFDGKKLNTTINPGEAVAYEAAVKAALASGEQTIKDITMTDVVPLSLGLENRLAGGKMEVLIERNTPIPVTVQQSGWTTVGDNQTSVSVVVYEGERSRAKDNNILGKFLFPIEEKVKAGVPEITYTFTVDANGILHVTAENKKTDTERSITIVSDKGRLKDQEIRRMVKENQALLNSQLDEIKSEKKDIRKKKEKGKLMSFSLIASDMMKKVISSMVQSEQNGEKMNNSIPSNDIIFLQYG